MRADPTAAPPPYPRARTPVPPSLDEEVLRDAAPLFAHGEKMQLAYTVRNTQRAIGARISSEIVRRFPVVDGEGGLADGRLTLRLSGSAGQSLGAWAVRGLRIELVGEANDYVAKGLSGAVIAIRPSPHLGDPGGQALVGSTCLYGATSGALYAAGVAGERFAVRNSGATAVVEGCGANGCEYMTGGEAVVLGPTGPNFAAGMTGGMAWVLDDAGDIARRLNPDSVVTSAVGPFWGERLRALVADHARETGSPTAHALLSDWVLALPRFVQVCPKEMLARLASPLAA